LERLTVSSMAALVAALLVPLGAEAFHSGGVAECSGCHSMHSPDANGVHLLVGQTPSDTCLTCHGEPGRSSYHVYTPAVRMPAGVPPENLTPGGDFGWLQKSYTFNQSRNQAQVDDGYTHGHNVVAPYHGLNVQPNRASAPGGSFPAASFECTSCHDPHAQYRMLSTGAIVRGGFYGQTGSGPFGATAPIVASGSYNNSRAPAAGQAVGVYRLLWGAGASVNGVTYAGNPIAIAPSTYNRSEATSQTRVAYGRGTTGGAEPWGTWCATCHGDMHSGTGNYVHPVDQSMSSLIPVYNSYVSSGDLSGAFTGEHLNQGPFNSLVPFIKNTSDVAALKLLAARPGADTAATLAGPADGDNVSCLSCHRAHASGFPYMLRWATGGYLPYRSSPPVNYHAPDGQEFITVADTATNTVPTWPGTDNGADPSLAAGRTELERRTAYYERPASVFGVYQRVLCNKCHGKD
jgi:predicted CXXCH cytochrome family protein